jgi:trimethylamine--corrinoid protein Co-methyltransferase
VHGGIPDVLGIDGNLDYSDPGQPLINSAMARLNLWVTGMASAQSGGSTSILTDIPAAVQESEISRDTLRTYGVHILRHAMGALGNLNYFSKEKFIQDCEWERGARKRWLQTRHDFLVPLYLPEDKHVVRGIREIMEKGGPKNADHTLTHVGAFLRWHDKLTAISHRKEYFPELDEKASEVPDSVVRGSEEDSQTQLQDTFLKT